MPATVIARPRLGRWTALAAVAASSVLMHAPAHAWTQNAHYWASVGVFGRFNVVTRDDFTAKHSDMQCGFAAGGNANLTDGYTVGRSNVNSTVSGRPQVGVLIGGNLNWTNASGTIDGDVYLGQTTSVNITNGQSPVNLAAGSSVRILTAADAFTAINQDLWVGWGNDTAAWGTGSLLPNNYTPGATGWTGYTSVNLNGLQSAFKGFFDDYLDKMAGGLLHSSAPANGTTTVNSYYSDSNGPRYNIMLDGRNLGRCDMNTNNASNCGPGLGAANTQPGGRRAVYIFEVDNAKLSSADEVRLQNTRVTDEFGSPTWTVVRVKDSGSHTATLARMGLQDFAPNNTRTLWVFDPTITTITINGVGVEGTILAPKANVIANNGNINGSIIAKSFDGTLEGHCAPFINYIDP